MPDDMPSDPFREGQPDWNLLAGWDAAFFAAHVAAGLPETVALELTKTYLHFWLGVMLANQAAQQQPGQQQDGQDQGQGG